MIAGATEGLLPLSARRCARGGRVRASLGCEPQMRAKRPSVWRPFLRILAACPRIDVLVHASEPTRPRSYATSSFSSAPRRFEERGVSINAVRPGVLRTGLATCRSPRSDGSWGQSERANGRPGSTASRRGLDDHRPRSGSASRATSQIHDGTRPSVARWSPHGVSPVARALACPSLARSSEAGTLEPSARPSTSPHRS